MVHEKALLSPQVHIHSTAVQLALQEPTGRAANPRQPDGTLLMTAPDTAVRQLHLSAPISTPLLARRDAFPNHG